MSGPCKISPIEIHNESDKLVASPATAPWNQIEDKQTETHVYDISLRVEIRHFKANSQNIANCTNSHLGHKQKPGVVYTSTYGSIWAREEDGQDKDTEQRRPHHAEDGRRYLDELITHLLNSVRHDDRK